MYMIGLVLIILAILSFASIIPIPGVVVMGVQGWQIKAPVGVILLLIGVYLEYGHTIMEMLGF